MHPHTDEYLELADSNGCSIMFEKAVPAGKLKREMVVLATHDGRRISLSTPQGFTANPLEIPRSVFDECLAENFIEQDGPEDADGRILFRLTQAGRSRVDLAQRPLNLSQVA